MARKKVPIKKKRLTTLMILAIIAGAGVFLMIAGFSVGAGLENSDGFCGSCHTQPESAYVQRAAGAAPVDLASFHTTKSTTCIACHSGDGLPGRVAAEMNGAHNLFQMVTHNYTQPSKLYAPFSDASCLKCHQDVVNQAANQNNHFHVFLARWQAADPNAGTCATCHPSHTTGGTADNGYMAENTVQNTCDACHQVLAHG